MSQRAHADHQRSIPDLTPLPEQLRRLGAPADVLELLETEHAAWRQLHDRLIALIATLLDVAAAEQDLQVVIDRVIADASVDLDALVSQAPGAEQIAQLLRAHGSTGSVEVGPEGTTFTHQCGSGLRYWRDNPGIPTVDEGEVAGVPGGRPRYCARCISSIRRHSDSWTVSPPETADGACAWTIAAGASGTGE